ncbi:MAG: hypothetical protein WA964_10530 [Ilumatobacter sp.]
MVEGTKHHHDTIVIGVASKPVHDSVGEVTARHLTMLMNEVTDLSSGGVAVGTASFDETVRVQHDEVAHVVGKRRCDANTGHTHESAALGVQQFDFTRCTDQDRRWMPRQRKATRRGTVEHQHRTRRIPRPGNISGKTLQRVEYFVRFWKRLCESVGGGSELTHDGDLVHAVTDDVTDNCNDLIVRSVDEVVPVSSELELAVAALVERCGLGAANLGQHCR